MENEEVLLETENPEGEANTETEAVVEKSEAELKAEEIGRNQRIRAEKAERELKLLKAQSTQKTEKETPKNDSRRLSLEELDEASELLEVPKPDRSEIVKYADREGITIAEAKKKPFVQAFLRASAEERKTAEVANTSTSRRSSKKGNDESILEDFSNNKLPESQEDMDRLVAAQLAARKKK